MKAREAILAEVDQTLDKLIQNAAMLKRISANSEYMVEIEALKKTQESLLAHLLHLQNYLKEKGDPRKELESTLKKLHLSHRPRVGQRKKALTKVKK